MKIKPDPQISLHVTFRRSDNDSGDSGKKRPIPRMRQFIRKQSATAQSEDEIVTNRSLMKRILASAAVVALFATLTLISNSPLKGGDNGRSRKSEAEQVQIGFSISPVKLNLHDKDPNLVGLGSYIVNAQAGCNDCHTCPSYVPGHNPFPAPFGVSGDGQINSANYLAGGIPFGPPPPVGVVSANLTPDSTGKPHGLTFEQFEIALRTGHDPLDPKFGLLAVMPWPYFRNMTNRDLEAIYTFLSAIPSATPGSCATAGQ